MDDILLCALEAARTLNEQLDALQKPSFIGYVSIPPLYLHLTFDLTI